MTDSLRFYSVLLLTGAAWGLTIPVTKVAVSGGHHPVGLIAWQTVLMTVFLTGPAFTGATLPRLTAAHLRLFLMIAFAGTLVPNAFSYRAASELPAGILSVLIAVVPMFALPIALLLGLERLQVRRLAGVLLGLAAILVLIGPEASLPRPQDTFWVLIALVPAFCYGIEGNYLALRGRGGLSPVALLWGASLVGALIAVPVAIAMDVWVPVPATWRISEVAIPAIAILHATAYSGYVWLVGRAGAVFASQVAYLVTGSGVLWSMALLGERYSGWVWLAFGLMLAGLALVQPRANEPAPAEAA